MTSYAELLKHPNWQKKRLNALKEADWCCTRCGDANTTLHVHHLKYVRGRKPWEYGLDELEVLCEPCHKRFHDAEMHSQAFNQFDPCPIEMAALRAGYLLSYAGHELTDAQIAAMKWFMAYAPVQFAEGATAARLNPTKALALLKAEKRKSHATEGAEWVFHRMRGDEL